MHGESGEKGHVQQRLVGLQLYPVVGAMLRQYATVIEVILCLISTKKSAE